MNLADLPWLFGIALALVFFTYFEARGLRHQTRQHTLSFIVYTIGSKWPLSIWLMGMFAGGLAVHFFWHWDPTCTPMGHG